MAVLFVCVPHARAAEPFSYRNFIWGVNKEDVRKYEKAVFYKEEGDSLFFLLNPDRFRRLIRYDFKDDKLAAIRFEYVELRLPYSGQIIDKFYDEQKALTELYGDPASEDAFWKDKRYQNHPAYWGRALYGRDLRLQTTWTPPGSTVVLQTYYDGRYYQLFYTMQKNVAVENTNAITLPAPAAKGPPQP